MFTSRILMLLLVIFSITSVETDAKQYRTVRKRGRADYLIVGLGTSGSVLARYLSDPVKGKYKNSVLVLEAGQNQSRNPIVTQGPAFLIKNIEDLAYNPKFAVTKIIEDTNIPVAGIFASEQFTAGRGWFGSSAHNFMVNTRGSSDRYDELAVVAGNNQWTYSNLLPLMKLLETYHGQSESPQERGTNGPLQISQEVALTTSDLLPQTIATALNAPIMLDYNVQAGNVSTSGGQDYSTPDFLKRSFGYDFLPRQILCSNGKGRHGRKLRVSSGAQVNRVIFKGNKAIGVEYYLNNNTDQIFVAYARKKVILCAGCPFSSAILQRSGIGPKDLLNELDIPVVVDNPLVGTGLKTHYGAIFLMSPTTNSFPTQFTSYSDGGLGDGLRNFQTTWQFGPVAVANPLLLAALNLTPATPGSFGFTWNLRPKSSGSAFIVDSSPYTWPNILFNLFTDVGNADLSAVLSMYRSINTAATAAGATMIFPPPSHFTGPESDQLLTQDIGGGLAFSSITVTDHYSGTCNMGTDISTSVVSGTDLHVFGTKNLMVVDNSIFPFPMTGGTSWQAYVAGIKAADILVGVQQ